MSSAWEPTASWAHLHRRAHLLADVRAFFAGRGVLEVETPLLAAAPASDPHLDAFSVPGPDGTLYLQTSPEYAMKRLLAAGSGPIYQLCKAFRRGERGRRHNPEFSMLEWYRPGFDLGALIDETLDVVTLALGERPRRLCSYREIFQEALGVDPLRADVNQLRTLARSRVDIAAQSDDPDFWLQLLQAECVEPGLGRGELTVVTDFPASQAALARVVADAGGNAVARRFEVFVEGMELANGYEELSDPDEQAQRFARDLAQRGQAGREQPPLDERLLAALRHGLPDCAGVALGFDRLLMLACGAVRIEDVLAFPIERA